MRINPFIVGHQDKKGAYSMNSDEMNTMLLKMQSEIQNISDTAKDRKTADLVDVRISSWEKRRATFVLVILAIFGVASYVSLNDKITNYFAKTVKEKIDAEVKRKTALLSTQDPQIANIATRLEDLSQSVAAVGAKIDKLNKEITPTVSTSTWPPVLVSKGYAFFGIKTVSGAWSEKYFDIKGASDRPPQPGDTLTSTGSVNIRSGYITYTDNGWVNQPTIGAVKVGQVFRVDDAKQVTDGFWWVSIIRE
jgi:hypothetical protein